MQGSPIRHLYRTAGWGVTWAALLSLLFASISRAQFAQGPKTSKGPRATGVVELQGKGARLIPIVILVNGQFYDASIYRADPLPMALDPGTVYEAERNGESAGLFTVGNAEQLGKTWYGTGEWQSNQELQQLKEARAKAEEQAKAATKASAQEEDSGPPILRKGDEKSQPASPPTPAKPPAQGPASKQPQQTVKASPPSPPAPPPPSTPDEYDPNRPVLRRGAPPAVSGPEPTAGVGAIPAGQKSVPGTPGKPQPKIEMLAAISDADGPQPRPYTFDVKAEEREAYLKKMQAYAQDAVGKYERVRHSDFASAQLGQADFNVFDVDLSNQAVFVFSAPATVSFGAKPKRAVGRRMARTSPPSEPVAGKREQAYVTVVGRVDIYGELRQLFSSVTDSTHLDEIPRLQLIDAVDVDGDGRGELLFREFTDTDKGFVIYRVHPDQLVELFDTMGPEE